MLGEHPIYVVLLSRDLGETRSFYHDKLGLPIIRESEAAISFRSGHTSLDVTKSTTGTADTQTQATWIVDDLQAEVAELRDRGVEIQEYDLPGLKPSLESQTSGLHTPRGSSIRTATRPASCS